MDVNFSDILATTTIFSTVFQFLTGAIICNKYIQKKSTGDTSGFPFVCGFLSCSLWLKYGFLTDEKTVVLVNVIGTSLFIIYSLIYFLITVNKKTILRQFLLICMVLLTSILYIQYEKDHKKAVQVMGILCCAITVVFFAAPFITLVHVIKSKNTESLPFPLIIASFLVSLQWLIYGIIINDIYIKITNFLGCILSGSQLLLFLCYPSRQIITTIHHSGGGLSYKPLEQSDIY